MVRHASTLTAPRGRERRVRPKQLTLHRSSPLTTEAGTSGGAPSELTLSPGLRDRLLERLVAMGLPSEKRVSFVAEVTGRASQTVRRWFASRDPGLPDLHSFARLCVNLGCSADDMLGLGACAVAPGGAQGTDLMQVAECVQGMAVTLRRKGRLGEPMRVCGDEMQPRLYEGDMVFVDRTANCLAGNGLYALECKGRVVIRRVEQQMGQGWVVKCDNRSYGDTPVETAAVWRRLGLRVIGKVQGAIALRPF